MDEEAISAVGIDTKVDDMTRGAPRRFVTFVPIERLAPSGRAFFLHDGRSCTATRADKSITSTPSQEHRKR